MIEDMEDKGILDKARMEGMNQGIWLAVQELAHDGRWTQAAEELVSSCGLSRIYLMMTRCLTGSVLSRIILGKSSISYSKLK